MDREVDDFRALPAGWQAADLLLAGITFEDVKRWNSIFARREITTHVTMYCYECQATMCTGAYRRELAKLGRFLGHLYRTGRIGYLPYLPPPPRPRAGFLPPLVAVVIGALPTVVEARGYAVPVRARFELLFRTEIPADQIDALTWGEWDMDRIRGCGGWIPLDETCQETMARLYEDTYDPARLHRPVFGSHPVLYPRELRRACARLQVPVFPEREVARAGYMARLLPSVGGIPIVAA